MARVWIKRLNTIARVVGVPTMARFAASAHLPIAFAIAACKGL